MPKKILKVLILAITILIISLFTSVFATNTNTSEDDNLIRYGFFYVPGVNDYDKDGNYAGYNIEYLNRLSEYTGWQYEYVEDTLDNCLKMLAKGEIDLIGAIAMNEERSKVFDASILPTGAGATFLCTLGENDNLYYKDYEGYNGITIGLLSGSVRNFIFEEYCVENNIQDINRIYFKDIEEQINALKFGIVDAIVVPDMTIIDVNIKVLDQFGVANFYFVTTKGNTKVLDKLNYGLEKIVISEPSYNNSLYEQYFLNYQHLVPCYTKEERLYLDKKSTYKIAYQTNWAPIEYFDTEKNEAKGITIDMTKLIAEYMGINLIPVYIDTIEEGIEKIKTGEVDLIASFLQDFYWVSTNNVKVPHGNIKVPICILKNNQQKVLTNTVGIVTGYLDDEVAIKSLGTSYKVQHYDTHEHCVEALNDGEIDYMFTNTYFADYYLSILKYRNLSVVNLTGIENHLTMAVSSYIDDAFLSALTKTIDCINDNEINNMILNNSVTRDSITIEDLFYLKPFEMFLALFVVLSAIIIGLIFSLKLRARNMHNISKITYTDDLTGYWNTRRFKEELDKILLQKDKTKYVVLSFTINKFSYISDAYGYKKSNSIIKHIANEVEKFTMENEFFARVSGDNFLVTLQYDNVIQLEERLKNIDTHIKFVDEEGDEGEYNYLLHFGIYLITKQDDDTNVIIDKVNYAREMEENLYKNTYTFYNSNVKERIEIEKEIEKTMSKALVNNEFIPYIQPKVDMKTKEIVGAEALVRWNNPNKGMLSPGVFIPIMEKQGFIDKIDLFMFEQICKKQREWKDEGKILIPISCNFSRQHFNNDKFAYQLEEMAKIYDVPTNMLEIEVTESVLTENPELFISQIEKIKEKGFRVSIDDFGTGYSSLGLLQSINVDVIKLDKAFFESGFLNNRSKEILKGVIEIAHNIDVKIVCEGVETLAQSEFLRNLDCNIAQGYLYYKPMPISEYEKLFGGE